MAKPKPNDSLLGSLHFEKKNKTQPRLPPNTKIQRRPLHHPPVASPYAGPSVQKVVYVSRSTPFMAAVKRVRKLLTHIEKRAMQDVDLANDRNGLKKLAEASEKLAKNGEEVIVKGSGRAIEQAVKVGEWFRSNEKEMACKVEVRTGNVQVVDDLVEAEEDEDEDEQEQEQEQEQEPEHAEKDNEEQAIHTASGETNVPGNEMEVRQVSVQVTVSREQVDALEKDLEAHQERDLGQTPAQRTRQKKSRRSKRKRPVYDKDDMPEARTRWISIVEVAISLKG